MGTRDSAIIVTVSVAVVGLAAVVYKMKSSKQHKKPNTRKSGLTLSDLTDPANRADHPGFNKALLEKYTDDAILLDDTLNGVNVYVVHKHERVVQVLQDHETFSSNPWPECRRLVTLNTMDKLDHDRIYRVVRRFYTQAAVGGLQPVIKSLVEEHGQRFKLDGDVYRFSKRFHMHLSLLTSGLFDEVSPDDPIIDQFIQWNDAAVRLTAPLGGVGTKPQVSFSSMLNLGKGMISSVKGVLSLIRRIGVMSTLRLLEPIEAIWPSVPYTHCWDYPDQLKGVPEYFVHLYDLMSSARTDSPAGALFSSIGDCVAPEEALATLVQLMVNMTTSNAIMSLMYRKIRDASVTVEDVLNQDVPLQRDPRRAKSDGVVGDVSIPKGSLLLLMIGAANESCPAGGVNATFGFGLHACLGKHLANLELNEVTEWVHDLQLGHEMIVCHEKRLTDVDVGNWGFSELRVRISPLAE